MSTGGTVEEACVIAQLIERAAKLQLLAMSAGTIKPIIPELGREAHDWIARPKRHAAAFNYYARQILRQHADCLN
ncbi:class II aldolase/adducin domain protein [compost metagenome]